MSFNLLCRLANFRARLICGGRRLPLVQREVFRRIVAARHVLIGAGGKQFAGWVSTEKNWLDLSQRAEFRRYWKPGKIVAFCAEHVWEHLEAGSARAGIANCHEFLQPGGTLRIAVPDGFHPSADYREWVRPGGSGPGADDHRILHTHMTLAPMFEEAGFCVRLVEWWDEAGQFHMEQWSPDQGPVQRSSKNDKRNADGVLRYTSLIVDGVKPA